jgi:Tfp pilus assembly protein PilV
MSQRSVVSDRSGLGLIEIMVAMGLVGVLALAVSAMSAQSMSAALGAKEVSALNTLQSQLQMVLSRPDACAIALQKIECGADSNESCKPVPVRMNPAFAGVQSGVVSRIVSPDLDVTLAEKGTAVHRYRAEDFSVERLAAPVVLQGGTYAGMVETPLTLRLRFVAPSQALISGVGPTQSARSVEVPLWVVTDPAQQHRVLRCTSQSQRRAELEGDGQQEFGTPDFSMQCTNLYYENSKVGNWVAAGCQQQAFKAHAQAGYYEGALLSPAACPSGYQDGGVSVTRSPGSGAAGFLYSRRCLREKRDASILKLSCANLWYYNSNKTEGNWVAVGCVQKPFSLVSTGSFQGETLAPPQCPAGFSDLGVSVRAKSGLAAAGFVYERICEKSGALPALKAISCNNSWITTGSIGGWVSVGCEQAPFVPVFEETHPRLYYQGKTLEPGSCPAGTEDLGISVDVDVEGSGAGFVYTRLCGQTKL